MFNHQHYYGYRCIGLVDFCSIGNGNLFFFDILPVGIVLLLIIFLITFRLGLIDYFNKKIVSKIGPVGIYSLGIPFIFFLSFPEVYLHPNIFFSDSISITNPLEKALIVSLFVSIIWPIFLTIDLLIDGNFISSLLYSSYKGIVCQGFVFNVDTILSFPLSAIRTFFGPLYVFYNGPLYFLICLSILMILVNRRHNDITGTLHPSS